MDDLKFNEFVAKLKRWVEIEEAKLREELQAEDIPLLNPFLQKIDELAEKYTSSKPSASEENNG